MTHFTSPKCHALVTSPVGLLSLKASEYGLTHLQVEDLAQTSLLVEIQTQFILQQSNTETTQDLLIQAQQHIDTTVIQLTEYFANQRQHFSVPLAPKGTVFQHEVWHALSQLTFGHRCSYSDIANTIGRPKAVRAVGAANGANPIAIIVPCHRVIGKGGKLTGYAYGLDMKQWLLDLEGIEEIN
ncbi:MULTISPECIES: methylated-DNA--[protein]-cysteine S-methyltransferase [unclassified Shewanella]|jgi:methylated-DNA-[protein]-cysteine S-methyltransferase|uniref:methylated-DNA--[protein]-cysteine S-methyltransferase n=1 Tax=unclassified Shewanella TaxID=196818 RepID=UPI00137BD831|nr:MULTISPECIES: methylated-DNA--[protein]-cysteine S-methyltransferase [unclassified Shewanella]MBB1363312.1 methylated-DNA--[protein]-cysteine S-methyltransferase [Shewanella sp. SR44-4]MBO1896983.1 methylated-DNA--[protein]-cysteine S-methyltransferase [Shewanella sp. BF02_Schw]QHS14233.1 methylated-DNA--[protein]-cysteine S-methyltransferase [Shewanella sp. Arc9-LZ]